MVAKETIFDSTSEKDELCFVKNSCLADYFARKFAKCSGVRVRVLPCYLYCVTKAVKGKSAPMDVFCGEDFMQGVFTKWISNNGYMSNNGSEQIHTKEAECFAHFTLQVSSGKYMVSDIQG